MFVAVNLTGLPLQPTSFFGKHDDVEHERMRGVHYDSALHKLV